MRTIFVSSTFKDMQIERDAIRDICAPAVNEEARKHGDEIDFCDLRWGINTYQMEEEESSLKVLNVCFNQIDRCQPPFVVLCGYRYGWIPDKKIVAKSADLHKLMLDDLEKSVTALEIEYGAFKNNTRTFVYLREIIDESIPSIFDYEDDWHQEKLNQLKTRLSNLKNAVLRTYRVHISDGRPEPNDIRQFAEMLVSDMKRELQNSWDAYDSKTPLEHSIDTHWNYVQEKRNAFTARKADAQRILSLFEDERSHIVICAGDSGSGKSTLLSYIASKLREEGNQVLPMISGLVPQTTDAFSLTKMIIKYLALITCSIFDEDKCNNTSAIKSYYRSLIEKLSSEQNYYIMIDAVDQLIPDENRNNAVFLPNYIPDNLHFLLTCTKDLKFKRPPDIVLDDLSEADQRAVIDSELNSIGKELHNSVIEHILNKKSVTQPLAIQLMVQRLCIMNVDDFDIINNSNLEANLSIANQQIEVINNIPEDLPGLSRCVFDEIGKRINSELCRDIIQLIAVSRYGLRVSDLIAVCKDKWSTLDFAHYINYLNSDFIIRSDGRYDFMHKTLRQGVLYDTNIKEKNERLCDHFVTLSIEDPLRQSEIGYHLFLGREFDGIKRYFVECADNPRKESLLNKLAENAHDLTMRYGKETMLAFIQSVAKNKEYQYYCYNFLIYYLYRYFTETKEQADVFLTFADAIYDLLSVNISEMPEEHQKAYMKTISEVSSNYAYSYETISKLREYNERLVHFGKEHFDLSNFTEREWLFNAYYRLVWSMKSSSDIEILKRAKEYALEGAKLVDEDFEEYLFKSANFAYVNYFGSLGEIHRRLGEFNKHVEMYKKDLFLRNKLHDMYHQKSTLKALAGSYSNMADATIAENSTNFEDAYYYSVKACEAYEASSDLTSQEDLLYYSRICFWRAIYKKELMRKKMKADDIMADDEIDEITQFLLKAYSATRFRYRQYHYKEALEVLRKYSHYILEQCDEYCYYVAKDLTNRFNEYINEDILYLKSEPTKQNLALRYETVMLFVEINKHVKKVETNAALLRAAIHDIEPFWGKYYEVQSFMRNLNTQLTLVKNDGSAVRTVLRKYESKKSFYIPEVKNKGVIEEAIRKYVLNIHFKDVYAYFDTSTKVIIGRKNNAVMFTANSIETSYKNAKHIEYRAIRSVDTVNNKVRIHFKSGNAVILDYSDPDSTLRDILMELSGLFADECNK